MGGHKEDSANPSRLLWVNSNSKYALQDVRSHVTRGFHRRRRKTEPKEAKHTIRSANYQPKLRANPCVVQKLDEEEKLCFEYFYTKMLSKLSGLFGSMFWTKDVYQLAIHEPAIRHAIISMAAIQRYSQTCGIFIQSSSSPSHCSSFMMTQYNKAISYVQTHLKTGSTYSCRIVLAACLTFIGLEMIWSRPYAAMQHWKCGLNMLDSLEGGPVLQSKENKLLLKIDHDSLDNSLKEAFAQLDMQSILCGMGSPKRLFLVNAYMKTTAVVDIPPKFESLQEARYFLLIIHNSIFHHNQNQDSKGPFNLKKLLQDWLAAIDAFSVQIGDDESVCIKILRIYYFMIKVMVSVPQTSENEMLYDNFIDDFRLLLQNATEIITTPTTEVNYSQLEFSTQMGIIAPLSFTVKKCRLPSLRRKAISLLALIRHREGMWDGQQVAEIAKQIASWEQSNYETASDMDLPLPTSRICQIKVLFPEDRPNCLKLICERPSISNPNGHETISTEISQPEISNRFTD